MKLHFWVRVACVSVVVAAIASPATAQTPNVTSDANGSTVLLSRVAFARLVQPPRPDVAEAAAVADPTRLSLLRQATAAVARQAPTTGGKAPQQKSWASRHKVLTGVIIGALGFFTFVVVCFYACEE